MIVKIHGVKRWKNSGNKIRSNQNKKLWYWEHEKPTKEQFEKWLHYNYGKNTKYKILSGSFKHSAA
mgnify:CR=1 FL=1